MASTRRHWYFFMRLYNIPPDMNEKEKVIGGVLNINQFFWLVGGLVLGASVFLATMNFLGTVGSAIIAVLLSLTGVPFAIYKKNGLTLFQYLTYKRKFKKKVKMLPNIRKNDDFDEYLNRKL